MFSIDAHHHFWNPDEGDYSWMTQAHAPVGRIFVTSKLGPALKVAGVDLLPPLVIMKNARPAD